jgi:hypothetical protein
MKSVLNTIPIASNVMKLADDIAGWAMTNTLNMGKTILGGAIKIGSSTKAAVVNAVEAGLPGFKVIFNNKRGTLSMSSHFRDLLVQAVATSKTLWGHFEKSMVGRYGQIMKEPMNSISKELDSILISTVRNKDIADIISKMNKKKIGGTIDDAIGAIQGSIGEIRELAKGGFLWDAPGVEQALNGGKVWADVVRKVPGSNNYDFISVKTTRNARTFNDFFANKGHTPPDYSSDAHKQWLRKVTNDPMAEFSGTHKTVFYTDAAYPTLKTIVYSVEIDSSLNAVLAKLRGGEWHHFVSQSMEVEPVAPLMIIPEDASN